MPKKNKEIIRLRGHHLDLLMTLFKRPKIGAGMIKNAIISEKDYGFKQQRIVLAERIIQVLKEILRGQTRVKLIDGIDDICQKCKRKRTKECSCCYAGSAEDRRIVGRYGLEMDKIYPAAEIINALAMARNGIRLRGTHLRLLDFFIRHPKTAVETIKTLKEFGKKHIEETLKILEMAKKKGVYIQIIWEIDDICRNCKERVNFNRNADCIDGWRVCWYQNFLLEYSSYQPPDDSNVTQLLGLKRNKFYPADKIVEKLKEYKNKLRG
ncbi:MAG: DUF1284 domain-containing protein [Patescibacteria group bacterium]|nr:DUF1284 domain-containing protein [Patescibacteria group bacterium]MDD5164605.1 DUF1284 domain-containing protein [Patescibacteria group bacterium]MDD5534553.1 DUF1284 domain-containing protein [Patescibacteria group bacterium]